MGEPEDGTAAAQLEQLRAEWDAHADLITALRDGDLLPLAKHLRSGAGLPQFIADEVADMIEGLGIFFNIKAAGVKPGEPGWSERVVSWRQTMLIGTYFERRCRENGKGGYEEALAETRAKFSVGKTRANDARQFVQEALARLKPEQRDRTWAMWKRVYSAP